MNFEQTITLDVSNWPRFQRSTTFVLDERLFPDERALRDYARRRFGEGVFLRAGAVDEKHWTYARRIAGPGWLWGALSRVLNKSYA